MKKLLFSLMLITGISTVNAQECPPGYNPSIVYSCELVFHRPKFDCKKGFWFCFPKCDWKIGCAPGINTIGYYQWLEKRSMTVFGEITNARLVFHFPNKVIELQQFSEDEKKTFNVDDALIFSIGDRKIQLIPGNYPTFRGKLETTIPVPFKDLY